jgi:hypothetical protein
LLGRDHRAYDLFDRGGLPAAHASGGRTYGPSRSCPRLNCSLTFSGPAAESATSALRSFPEALEGGPANVDVYLGVRDGKSFYTGISNNIGRRALQHGDRFDELRQVTTTPVTRGRPDP